MFAAEKKTYAIVTFRNMRQQLQWHDVTVVAGNMRNIEIKAMLDIIVSEILWFFGNNELSPECLDGATPMLKEHGV